MSSFFLEEFSDNWEVLLIRNTFCCLFGVLCMLNINMSSSIRFCQKKCFTKSKFDKLIVSDAPKFISSL